jgi:general secretion pathway protein D
MKTIHLRRATARQASLVLILFLTALGLEAQTPPTNMTPAQKRLLEARLHALTNRPAVAPAGLPPRIGNPASVAGAPTPATPATTPTVPATAPGAMPPVTSSPAAAPPKEEAGIMFNFAGVDVQQVLNKYANLVGRTLIQGPVPQVSIVLHTQSDLTKSEAIEALQAVLGLNGITLVNIGDKFVKVLPPDQAPAAAGPFNEESASQLPDMGSYVTHIVQLHYVKPSTMLPVLQPFARLPNSIIPLDDNGILILRDYAENVKRMLEMIAKVDVSVPAEYISEVIPIKYALADDIANALNSLGGGGGATVAIGNTGSRPGISGLTGTGNAESRLGGMNGPQNGLNGLNSSTSQFGQSRTGLGAQAPNARPAGNPFQQRLLNIISHAGGGTANSGGEQPIQVFGQAKIIADERSNSLLIFATRQDMVEISNIIEKLDVLLPQVLIEAVVIDYSLGPNTMNFGVSAAQGPQGFSSNPQVLGAGGVNNGQSFLNLLNSSSLSNSVFGNNLGGGLSYFGNIGPRWDVALQAAASDSHASIIQRPRVLAEQAKQAQFFVGETVPYVNATYNYGGAYGNSSSYSQLSVGVELDVTPYINPDGLVDMIIQQEIDDINGYTTITGVGNIPNTDKRVLSSEIAVRNRDTVMLGGFIKNSKSTSRAGVPLLEDIPLLGGLFSSHSSSKQREELIVLMRPTVLKTPSAAAENTIAEEQRLPGVSDTAAQDAAEQAKAVEAERKKEGKNSQSMSGGFYNSALPAGVPEQPSAQPQAQGGSFFTPVAPNGPVTPDNYNYNDTEPQH